MYLTNEKMMSITKNMPMKQIAINGKPYLQRYYAGTFSDKKDLWIHRFLSNDGERHLHSHPFDFTSIVLCGGYTEEYLTEFGTKLNRRFYANKTNTVNFSYSEKFWPPYGLSIYFIDCFEGGKNTVNVFDWHRIAEIEPETWTAVIVNSQRLPKWYFQDDDGALQDVKASQRDWWKNYNTRPECDISLDDNRLV